jgi:2-dehydro-3-deoxygluconokinase
MVEVVSIGETMVAFIPDSVMPLRYAGTFSKAIAGSESNVSVGLAKLGHPSGWISKLGDDEFGAFVLRELRGEGVDTAGVVITDQAPTGIMFKQFSPTEESSVTYYRAGSAASTLDPADLDESYLAQAKILFVSGITPALGPRCKETVEQAVETAHRLGLLVCFDPNIRLKLWGEDEAKATLLPLLAKSDIVLLGEDEAKILLGTEDPVRIVDDLRDRGVRWMAVKRGNKGSFVADSFDSAEIPIYPMQVVDTIGAGDAYDAGFLAGLLEEMPVAECGRMASLMGAFAVSAHGDIESLPSRTVFDRERTGKKAVCR